MSDDRDAILAEGAAFSRHLLGSRAESVLLDRYAQASARLCATSTGADERLLRMCLRYPFLLGPVDAATALMRPRSLIRKKLLLMAAILEATPQNAGKFLPRPTSLVGLAAVMLAVGAKTALQLPIGAVLIWAAERRK